MYACMYASEMYVCTYSTYVGMYVHVHMCASVSEVGQCLKTIMYQTGECQDSCVC